MTKIGYTIVHNNPNSANIRKGAIKQSRNITANGDSAESAGLPSWATTEKLIKLIRINIDKKKKLFLEYSVNFAIRKPCLNLFYLNGGTISK